MPKIVLSKEAPEGLPLAGQFGLVSFDAGKAKSYETDDALLLAEVARSRFFEVEDADKGVSAADAKAYAKDQENFQNAHAEWVEKVEANVDTPWIPLPPEPFTTEDLTDDGKLDESPVPKAAITPQDDHDGGSK